MVVTLLVLHRLEGLSDREAVERYSLDAPWRYAAGGGGYGTGGWASSAHTVLGDMRATGARGSSRPVFEASVEAAEAVRLVGRRGCWTQRRCTTRGPPMDTVTLIRSAVRSSLAVADDGLEGEPVASLASADDEASSAGPAWSPDLG